MGKLYLVKTGEDVIEAVKQRAKSIGFKTGVVLGIGALSGIEFGHYNPKTTDYTMHTLDEQMELTGLIANVTVSKDDGELLVHAHATVSTIDGSVKGGHLFRATANPFVELYFQKADSVQYKKFSDSIKLNKLIEGEVIKRNMPRRTESGRAKVSKR